MSQDNTKIGTTSTTSTDATVTPSVTTEEKPKDDILSSISLRPGGFFGAKKPIQPSRYDDTPTTSTTSVTPQTNNNNNNNKQNKQYNNNKNDNQWKDQQDNKQNKSMKDGGRYNEGMNMGMGMGMGNPQKQEERPETFGGEPFSSKSYPEKKIYDRVFMKKLQMSNNSVPNELDSAFQEFPELKNSNKYQDRGERSDRDRSYTSPKQEGQGQGQGQNRVPNKFAKQPYNNQGQPNQNQYQNNQFQNNQYQNNQYQNNQYQNNQYQKNNQNKGGDMGGQKGLARRAENPWAPRPSFLKDEKDQVLRDIKGVLNKITPDKFTKLTQKIKNYFEKIPDDEIFAEAISLVFAKAVSEPNFSKLYAELCTSLNSSNLPFTKDPTAFRRALLNRCQEQFERVSRKLEDLPEDPEERLLAKEKERKNKVGNVKFIGELFKFNLLGEKIIHGCIKVLFNGIYKFETEGDKESLEMNAELLCKLISTIGGMIDHEKAKGYMDTYCQHIKKFTQDEKLSPRIRFMFQAVLELRENNWKPRREENAPMKIREVHDEAKRKAIEDELFLGEPEPSKPASQSILNKDKDKDTKGTPTTSTFVDAKSKSKKKKKPTDKNVKSSSDSIDDDIEQQLSSILSDYLSSGDVREAANGLKDLTKGSNQASYINSKFVEYGVIYALEKHEKEREQTSKLFVSLFNENVLTQDNFVKGFKTVLETLPDLIVDIPFADKMIGKFIGEAVQAKCINISYFEGINEKVKSSLMEVVNKK